MLRCSCTYVMLTKTDESQQIILPTVKLNKSATEILTPQLTVLDKT